jgi:hypothetical protein
MLLPPVPTCSCGRLDVLRIITAFPHSGAIVLVLCTTQSKLGIISLLVVVGRRAAVPSVSDDRLHASRRQRLFTGVIHLGAESRIGDLDSPYIEFVKINKAGKAGTVDTSITRESITPDVKRFTVS